MRSGYSLIEVMIALVVLSATMMISINIITSTADSENLNKDILIATELAEEGLQAGMNLYQTNLMKYGEENIEECALVMEAVDDPILECPIALKLSNGNYFVYLLYDKDRNTMDWSANEVLGDLVNDDGSINKDYMLSTLKFEQGTLYTLPSGDSDESKYFRQLQIEYLPDRSGIQFASTVAWLRAGGFVTRKTSTTIVSF